MSTVVVECASGHVSIAGRKSGVARVKERLVVHDRGQSAAVGDSRRLDTQGPNHDEEYSDGARRSARYLYGAGRNGTSLRRLFAPRCFARYQDGSRSRLRPSLRGPIGARNARPTKAKAGTVNATVSHDSYNLSSLCNPYPAIASSLLKPVRIVFGPRLQASPSLNASSSCQQRRGCRGLI